MVARDHPLADSSRLTLNKLAVYPAILPGLATYTGRIVAELFAARGIEISAPLSTNYLETISMLTGIGLGWSLLPRSMLTADLVPLETDAPPQSRTLGCVTNPARTGSNAANAFGQILGHFAD
jgi:DNA-binding transcriptional LysR family regulator